MTRSVLMLLLTAQLAAPAGEVLTHEAMWLMKRVGAPVVSPDGRWAVFPVTEPAYDQKDQVSDLWMVPADGSGGPRRLTSTKSGESGIAWSPDSRRVAFSARREGDEAPEIYVIDIAQGGEAVRITTLATGASAPRFSPDGRTLLFTSNVYPEAADEEANRKIAADRKARKYSARVFDGFPIRYWDQWVSETRPHLFVQPAEPGAKARDLLAGTRLAASRGYGGRPTTGTGGSGEALDAEWAPEGGTIVFVATTDRDAGAYSFPVYRIYRLPLLGGEPEQLVRDAASYSSPTFAPDGKSLYALRQEHGKRVYALTRLARLSWPAAGSVEVLTAALDRSVENFAVSGESVYFTAEDAGQVRLYAYAGGAARPLGQPAGGVYSGLSAARAAGTPVLAGVWESSVNPAEVFRIGAGGERHRLTEFAVAEAERFDWLPPLHFTFTSKKGRTIHNMIVRPPAFDEKKKYPLVHIIHGGPNNMWRDQITLRWNYHLLAAPGYAILLTNYTGSTGFGEQFAQRIEGDPFVTPGEELNQAADEAARRYPWVDGSRACAGGASYGGSLANWLLATTTRYRCLINHAGIFNLESMWGTTDIVYWMEARIGGPVWEQGAVWRTQNPARYAARFQTPILVTHGENDYRVPLNQALELWSVLQRRRVPSRLVVFPDENHWVLKGENSRYYYQEVHAWLEKYLKN
ncbi:MAG: S9 family peptidase [Bryobacterales bacterium]|nr:S9 family peptidase [Bryobacterales bacterium]